MANPTILRVGNSEINHNDVVIHLKAGGQYQVALQDMIKIRALENYAGENNIEAGSDELQQFVNDRRKEMGLFAQKDLQNYLGSLGISADQWVDSLEVELLRKKIKERIITDEKLQQYFSQNKLQFVKIELYKIVCESKGAAEEIIMEARDDHEDFSAIAMKYSIDPQTRASGGYLGSVARGQLPPDAESKVFTSAEGEIIGPFKEGDFFTVYKIGSVIKPELDDAMKSNLKDRLFEMWTSQLVQSQRIQVPES
jgi:parvulin-like peptidyl-prolyl isomerase